MVELPPASDGGFARWLAVRAGDLLIRLREEMGYGDPDALRAAGDKYSHELIVEQLGRWRPVDAVLSEEGADDPARLNADRVWIVDPLDGTREYGEAGRTDWAVHIGLWGRTSATIREPSGAIRGYEQAGSLDASRPRPAQFAEQAGSLDASRPRPARFADKSDPRTWGRGGPTVRLGLSSVRTLGDKVAERIEVERASGGPYQSMADLARRAGLSTVHLEALATADAFACFGLGRREALWAAGAAAQETADRLPGTTLVTTAPMLPGMDEVDRLIADVWATGLAPDAHPAQFAREYLDSIGATSVERLRDVEHGRRVWVGGIVTHRQRPATAGGITFINLEDETGMLNVTCTPGLWLRYRRVARTASAMVIRGRLEKVEGVLNLRAEHLSVLKLPVRSASRDFR
jgi:hypothetical protein